MMYLKECPKCHGDLIAGEDVDGKFLSCIQCGYIRELPVEPRVDNSPYTNGETFVIDAPAATKKRRRKAQEAA